MVLCPQSLPVSPPSCHPYPSPRSKSPPSISQFKATRKLPILKYPLTDITNLTLAQAKLELSNLVPIALSDECPRGQRREIYIDSPPRRGRGKNRRGRQRGVHARDVGGSVSGGPVLRSPIPLAETSPRSPIQPTFDIRLARRKSKPAPPILSDACNAKSFHHLNTNYPQTPRRRAISVSAVTPQTPSHGCRRSMCLTSNSQRGHAVLPPSPPSPTPTVRREPGSHNPIPDVPKILHLVPPLPPFRFPTPPSSRPASSQSTHERHISLIPGMSLVSGISQGQGRKKRTKRDLAEVHWQITMHKSLAWRTTRDQLSAERRSECKHCTSAKGPSSLGGMDFAQGGLKIILEPHVCTCARGNVPQGGNGTAHWTESLDRELVKRLWVKLIAQGCRTTPTNISNNPPQVSAPFPTTIENSHQSGIPFPSGQPGQPEQPPLAPAIQFSTASPATSDSQKGIPVRQRVSAIASSSKPKPRPSSVPPLNNMHVSSAKACTTPITVSVPPSPSFSADSTYLECQVPRISALPPRGILSPSQLTAQAILRHGDTRLKPMRRSRPPGLMIRESSLRHEVVAKQAEAATPSPSCLQRG